MSDQKPDKSPKAVTNSIDRSLLIGVLRIIASCIPLLIVLVLFLSMPKQVGFNPCDAHPEASGCRPADLPDEACREIEKHAKQACVDWPTDKCKYWREERAECYKDPHRLGTGLQ